MLRQLFDRDLQRLEDRLLALGSEVGQNINKATDALLRRDAIISQRLIAADEQVNHEQISIEQDSLSLIATQQPIARDLRFIASVMAIAGELERINDYAKGIAKINLLIGQAELLAPAGDLQPMAEKASEMLNQSLQAFVQQDVQLAYQIYAQDDEVDGLYNRLYEALIASIIDDVAIMEQATHLLWAAHNLERTADRVANICERVIFVATGEIVESPEEMEVPYPQ